MAGNRYCCTMRRSVNRERIDVTEIGLNSPKVLGLAVLGTGVTIACFHGFGGLPSTCQPPAQIVSTVYSLIIHAGSNNNFFQCVN